MLQFDCQVGMPIQKQLFQTSNEDYIIKMAEPSDFEKIVSLVNDAYWNYQKTYFTDSEKSRVRTDLSALHAISTNPLQKLLVLYDKTKQSVSGVIVLDLPAEKKYAKFGMFALDPSCKGTSLGKEMISFVERCAQENERRRMKIEVFIFAPHLERHYQSLGYISARKEKKFPHNDCIRDEYRNERELYVRKMTKEF